ncbi:AsmA family protein [Afifella sp. JA880]|uniref:AsmA family protein n=1 Tax=Afifella sp. JA880 TaxID=2975280 RepID=UPI0021BAA35A|nr:AsmA family protein [Afifella sp. JA880]MCT8267157.1 AsmA family protein [Afifella sp. JA880]
MMRRLLIALGLLVVLVGGLAFLASQLVSPEDVKRRVAEQISAWTGREVSLEGEAVITLLPRLSVKLKDVEIAGPPGDDTPFVQMAFLKASVRLLPLLIGEVEIEDFTIVAPVISLRRAADGAESWDFDTSAAALQLAFAGDVRLGSFVIENGRIVYSDELSGRREVFSKVNLNLQWDSVRKPIEVSGRFVRHGEEMRITASAQQPYRFIRAGETTLNLDVQAKSLNASFSGTVRDPRDPHLLGRLALNLEDAPTVLSWFSNRYAEASPFQTIRLDSDADIAGNMATFSDATLNLNGVSGKGALRLDFTGTPSMSGTLAFPSFDTTPVLHHLFSVDDGEAPAILKTRLTTGWLDDFKADLRVSAGEVRVDAARLHQVGASLLVQNGHALLTIGEAELSGGRLSGNITLDVDDGLPRLQTALRAHELKTAGLTSMLGTAPIEGTADVMVELTGSGEDVGAMLQTATGRLTVDAKNGRLPYLDLEAAAKAPEGGAQPLLKATASTPFTQLKAGLTFAEGQCELTDGLVETSRYTASLAGEIGLRDRRLDLSGTLTPKTDQPAIPVDIIGTLASPELTSSAPASN